VYTGSEKIVDLAFKKGLRFW